MTSASLVLWEIHLSYSLSLCPKNLRGWGGHFQSHFLSSWEQAARWAFKPRLWGWSRLQAVQCLACSAVPSPIRGLDASWGLTSSR